MRFLDIVAGLLGLPLLGVPLAILSALGVPCEVRRSLIVGRRARLIARRTLVFGEGRRAALAERLRLPHFFDMLSLLRGDLALVGPRPLTPVDGHAFAAYRVVLRPGLISPYAVQQRANIAYDSEEAVDFTYAQRRSFAGDLGLLVRAFLAGLHGTKQACPRPRIDLDGIPVDNVTLSGAVARILAFLDHGERRFVSFINADCLNRAGRNSEYREALTTSDLVLGDGVGVRLMSRLLGQPLRENVNGTDLFPRLCGALEGTPHSVYLLGGRPGIAAAVALWIQTRHPACRIAGFQHGYFRDEDEAEVIANIRRSGASLLLVAFGAPGQELWLKDHLEETGARVGIGVGGLFDFYSGRIPRAPQWMREAGLEWVYRFIQEPRRLFWRYGPGNVEFLSRAIASAVRNRAHQGPADAAARHAH